MAQRDEEEKQGGLGDAASELGSRAAGKAAEKGLEKAGQAAAARAAAAAGPPGQIAAAVAEALKQAKDFLKSPTRFAKSGLKKLLIIIAAGCGCILTLLIGPLILIVLIILPFFFLMGSGGNPFDADDAEAEEPEALIAIEKTAEPNRLDIGATGQVRYTIIVSNNSSREARDLSISDSFSGDHAGSVSSDCDFNIDILAAGESETKNCTGRNINTSTDWILTNTVTVNGSLVVSTTSSGGLNYYIPYGNTSIAPVNPQSIRDYANTRWPDNNIDDICPGGITCWDYVIRESAAHGISPAFAITVWREEGGFGGIINDRGERARTEFGCGSGNLNFTQSFNCFLSFTGSEHPYDPQDPYGSYREWVDYMCGPNLEQLCVDPSQPTLQEFPNRIRDIFNEVAPGHVVTVPPTGGGSVETEPVSVSATARVIIGNPIGGPPVQGPLKGIYCSGFGFQGYTPPCPSIKTTHNGIDVASDDYTVYSPFAGPAEVVYVDTTESTTYGNYIKLRSGEWEALLAHEDLIYVEIGDIVDSNTPLGRMDCTGFCEGTHVHYELRQNGTLVNPIDYGGLTPHP